MTAAHIIVGGIVGFLIAAVVGVIYTVRVGGIEQGQGDLHEYVVSGMLLVGIVTGCVIGWWLA